MGAPARAERADLAEFLLSGPDLGLLGLERRRQLPRQMTQVQLAETLGISQGNVSRLETRSDVYLSTLRSYVEALGGHLEIAAVFGDERVAVAVGPSQPPNSG